MTDTMTLNTAIAPAHAKTEEQAMSLSASTGEKQYDLLVYTGLNYWANLALSLFSADYFSNGAGRKGLNKIIAITEGALTGSTLMKQASALKTSNAIWKTLALTSGGIVASLLTKPLEDHKRSIVHWLNKRNGLDQTAPDGHEMTPDEIYIEKEQPHQTWWNVIKRRIYASVVIVSAGVALDHTIGMQNVKEAVVDTVNDGLKAGVIPGGKTLAKNAVFQRYLGFAALDTFFAAVHATVMKLTNGAKRARMFREIGNENDPRGIDKGNAIIIAPEQKTDITEECVGKNGSMPLAIVPQHLDQFARKKILPRENYTDLVAVAETSTSLVPR